MWPSVELTTRSPSHPGLRPSQDPSFLHNLVQLIHHTTTHGKPVAHTFILRSQASFALGWVVCLYEWGVSGDGVLQLKAWEGGWKGEKGLKQMVSQPDNV